MSYRILPGEVEDIGGEVFMRRIHGNEEGGFTLIELLTVIGIIGVLASLSLTSFGVYKASAALAVVETTIHDARNAFEGGIIDSDNLPASVALTTQNTQGPPSNASASNLLPGFVVPKNILFSVSYDNTCTTGACALGFLQARHCQGEEYIQWTRYGDGVEIKLPIAGSGCT